jgi:hypothetical protein
MIMRNDPTSMISWRLKLPSSSSKKSLTWRRIIGNGPFSIAIIDSFQLGTREVPVIGCQSNLADGVTPAWNASTRCRTCPVSRDLDIHLVHSKVYAVTV